MTIQLKKCAFLVTLLAVLFSCKKDPKLSPREEQEQNEQTAVLLPNEILEQEGLRFILNYDQDLADIDIKVNKSAGVSEASLTLVQDQPYVNYYILAGDFDENSDFILTTEFKNVVSNGSFDLSVIGFTNLNQNKKFTISGISFTTTDQGSNRKLIKIHKGIKKYTFSAYN